MGKIKQKSVISYLQTVKRCLYDSKRCSSLEVGNKKYVEGKIYHGFLCRQTKFIPEWNANAYLFQHSKLQCEYMHIDQKASESTLAIGFRTTSLQLNGTETILRNMILAQMDPYLNMFGRHLSRIGEGYTLFQFSSWKEENFKNLQEIVFECIFNAKLNYSDFLLKGIRLEFSEKSNQNSPIQFNGVAYNELKKIVCNNEASVGRWMKASILPDYSCTNHFHLQYPSFEELKDIYKKYYHPSNCKLFSCGGFNLEKVLDVLNNKFLYKYNFCDTQFSDRQRQQRLSESQNVHLSCRLEQFGRPPEEQSQINLAFLMTDLMDVYETFVASTLSKMLLHSRSLYFHKELHESNISYGGYSPSTGFKAVIQYTIFCVGLHNIKPQNFPKFKEKFKNVVEKALTEGINTKIVQKVLKDLEVEMRCSSENIPKHFLLNFFPIWNCGGDIIKALDLSCLIRQLNENLKEKPTYLNEKIEEYFLNNNHQVTITMSPDPNYDIKFRNTERAVINGTVLSLSEDHRNEIYDSGIFLNKIRKEKGHGKAFCNIHIPSTVIESPVKLTLQNIKIKDVPINIYELPDNEVTSFKCIFNARHISPELMRLIPFLSYSLNEKFGYSATKIDLHFAEDLNDSCKHEVGISLKAQFFKDDSQCFDIISQFLPLGIIDENDLDRFISELWTKLTRNCGEYVIGSSRGLVTSSSKLRAELTSLELIDFMIRLRRSSSIEDIQNNLQALHTALFNLKCMRCLITTSDVPGMKIKLQKLLELFPSQDIVSRNYELEVFSPSNRHFVAAGPLNFCAQSCLTVPYNHPHHKTLQVLVSILNYGYCRPCIQDLCGASLAGVQLGKDGVLIFYSFDCQDPKKTFDLMETALIWLRKQRFEMELIEMHKISVSIDNKSIADKIDEAFAYNSTLKEFSKYKKEILNVTQNNIKEVAELYLTPQQRFSRCFIGAKGAQPKIDNEKWTSFWE